MIRRADSRAWPSWMAAAGRAVTASKEASAVSVSTASGNWQLIYRIAQRLTLRAQAGVDASTITANTTPAQSWALDMIYTWHWN